MLAGLFTPRLKAYLFFTLFLSGAVYVLSYPALATFCYLLRKVYTSC